MINKSDIAKWLAMRIYGDTRDDSLEKIVRFMDTFESVIIDALIAGDKIKWCKFITIEPVKRKPHNCITPSVNKVFIVPEQIYIKCRFSKAIKNVVNFR